MESSVAKGRLIAESTLECDGSIKTSEDISGVYFLIQWLQAYPS